MNPKRGNIFRMMREAGVIDPSPYVGVRENAMLAMERFTCLVIADFLARTGQYITNDASREAAINAAHLEGQKAMQELAAIHCEQFSLVVSDSDWSKGYATALKDAACGIRAMEVKP